MSEEKSTSVTTYKNKGDTQNFTSIVVISWYEIVGVYVSKNLRYEINLLENQLVLCQKDQEWKLYTFLEGWWSV